MFELLQYLKKKLHSIINKNKLVNNNKLKKMLMINVKNVCEKKTTKIYKNEKIKKKKWKKYTQLIIKLLNNGITKNSKNN